MGTLLVVGAGNLGGAILRGLLAAEKIAPNQVVVCEKRESTRRALRDELQIECVESVREASFRGKATVLLAVKPQDIESTVKDLAAALKGDATVVTVVGGVPTSYYRERLPARVDVVRVMPNIACLVGKGVSGIYGTGRAVALAETILSAVGRTVVVARESDLTAITSLSASGTGFLFVLLEAFIDGGVKLGLTREQSSLLAAQSMLGAAAMVLDGEHPGVLKDRVASPAGTTIAGLHVLEKAGIRGTIISALEASAARAEVLGQNAAQSSGEKGRNRKAKRT